MKTTIEITFEINKYSLNELPTRKESNREHFLPGRYPGFHNDYPPDYRAYERL